MAGSTTLAVRAVLREAERPLKLKEITPLVLARHPLTTTKPENTIRHALMNDPACVSDGDGRWVYLPTFVRGAAMRSSVRLSSPETGELAVTVELIPLLWPVVEPGQRPRPPKLKLDGGPTVRVGWSRKNGVAVGHCNRTAGILKLPDPFWSWWGRQQAEGANTLVIRCEDGEAGRYTGAAIHTPLPAYEDAAEDHAALHDAAKRAIRRSQGGVWLTDLAGRLLVRGLYHHDDPHDLPPPFLPGLMLPLGRFVLSRGAVIQHGWSFTPGLARVLAMRLLTFWYFDETDVVDALGLPVSPPAIGPPVPRDPASEAPVAGHRYTVMLTRQPAVWRRIELRGDQTLEDLHDAIQDAFGWDDRHLYAFFMSGSAWDQLTEIGRPLSPDDLPPTADIVRLVDLDLPAGRHFLYLFDFGDELRHVVTFEGAFPLADEPAEARFPRTVAGEGAASQYPEEDEDDLEEDDDLAIDDLEIDDLDDFIDEGLALGLITLPGETVSDLAADLSGLASYPIPDLAELGFPTLTRFPFPPSPPGLHRLPVDLDELGSAVVEEPSSGLEVRLDLTTGELLWLFGDEDDPDERALQTRIAADPLRYARLPLEGQTGIRSDMETYLPSIADPGLQERLRRAMASTRPRRRFFDALAHFPEEQERWVDFSERRLAERIIAWLASCGVAPNLPRRR